MPGNASSTRTASCLSSYLGRGRTWAQSCKHSSRHLWTGWVNLRNLVWMVHVSVSGVELLDTKTERLFEVVSKLDLRSSHLYWKRFAEGNDLILRRV
eukprot:747818-Hanusia_phi.AAC.4